MPRTLLCPTAGTMVVRSPMPNAKLWRVKFQIAFYPPCGLYKMTLVSKVSQAITWIKMQILKFPIWNGKDFTLQHKGLEMLHFHLTELVTTILPFVKYENKKEAAVFQQAAQICHQQCRDWDLSKSILAAIHSLKHDGSHERGKRHIEGLPYLCLLRFSGRCSIIIFCPLVCQHLGHCNCSPHKVRVIVQPFSDLNTMACVICSSGLCRADKHIPIMLSWLLSTCPHCTFCNWRSQTVLGSLLWATLAFW